MEDFESNTGFTNKTIAAKFVFIKHLKSAEKGESRDYELISPKIVQKATWESTPLCLQYHTVMFT